MEKPDTYFNEMQSICESKKKYVENLLHRMSDSTPATADGESIASIAQREAEQLSDISLVLFLRDLISTVDHPEHRINICFLLACINRNTGDIAAANALVNCLKTEADKTVIWNILFYLQFYIQAPISDCTPLIPYLRHPSGGIRLSATQVFGRCVDLNAIDVLLSIVNDQHYGDIGPVLRALAECGGKAVIPHMLKFVNDTNLSVRVPAIHALNKIADTSLEPVFIELLRDPQVQWQAMAAIHRHGTMLAVPHVIDRIKEILSKRRFVEELPKSELRLALEFLYRLREEDLHILSLFDWVRNEKIEFLFEQEKSFLKTIRTSQLH